MRNGTTLADIRAQSRALGIERIGVTDHLDDPINDAQLRACRAELDALDPEDREGFFFGVEVSTVREWDLNMLASTPEGTTFNLGGGGPPGSPIVYLPDELCEELQFDYVLGGAHFPLGVTEDADLIRDWHSQQMCLATHPRIAVVAHPWRWLRAEFATDGSYRVLAMPWLGDFAVIPRSMHEEFAAALRESDTACELHAGSFFEQLDRYGSFPSPPIEAYLDYCLLLRDAGVRFSIGSDSHGPGYDHSLVLRLSEPLATLDLTDSAIWHPDQSSRLRAATPSTLVSSL